MNTQSAVDTRIKVGIIGFGMMGRFYWEAMTKSDRWNIAYICDTDPASRQLAKKLSPNSIILEDNQKIFEDESMKVPEQSVCEPLSRILTDCYVTVEAGRFLFLR